jgi:hypothetical protein
VVLSPLAAAVTVGIAKREWIWELGFKQSVLGSEWVDGRVQN